MTSPRVIFFGYSEVGAVGLETLIALGGDIRGVFTYEDDPNEAQWFRSVADIARKAGIPVFTTETPNAPESVAQIRALEPELLLSFYYRDMLGDDILRLPRLGAFNLHGSLLPKYRGRACINWAILKGETETGATLHEMVASADAGDIIDQERVPIAFSDTALEVSNKVARAAGVIVRRSWPLLAAGKAPRTPQNTAEATKFGRRRPEDGRIDWTQSALDIYNLIRAVTHPWPGAFTTLDGKKLFVWKALPEDGSDPGHAPGEVLSLNPLRVATGAGSLCIEGLQLEGDEERSGAEFAARYLSERSRFGNEA